MCSYLTKYKDPLITHWKNEDEEARKKYCHTSAKDLADNIYHLVKFQSQVSFFSQKSLCIYKGLEEDQQN